MRKPIRAVAIIIDKDNILLIWRVRHGQEYYVLPGGGVEDGESVEEAVIREVKEETSLDVAIDRLIYHHHYLHHSNQYFYLCHYKGGEPALGECNEKEEMQKGKDDFYKPIWVKIADLAHMLVYPLEIRDWLLEDVKDNFKQTPREAQMRTCDLRRRL